MSAQMILVRAVKYEHGGTVNSLGYAHCLDCRPFRADQWTEAGSLPGPCDGCGKEFSECAPIVIEGASYIEFPQTKIF